MKQLFDQISFKTAETVTKKYSTSFSMATSLLEKEQQKAIYAIYAFVRLADEIVDTFHQYNKPFLLEKFENDLQIALKNKISLNPVLHAFQIVVHQYKIPYKHVNAFLTSMKYDLEKKEYKTKLETDEYIYGSADVVGLMCLRVFCKGEETYYHELKSPAMKLGSAFQKVNFLRDLKNDTEALGITYFTNLNYNQFTEETKSEIIQEIEHDFFQAYKGIKKLPSGSKIAVFVAYLYYKSLLKKLKNTPAEKIKESRIRISNSKKIIILLNAKLLSLLNLI